VKLSLLVDAPRIGMLLADDGILPGPGELPRELGLGVSLAKGADGGLRGDIDARISAFSARREWW
jgi:hypothetical protein